MGRDEHTGLTKFSLISEQVREVLYSPSSGEDREGFRLSVKHPQKKCSIYAEKDTVVLLF